MTANEAANEFLKECEGLLARARIAVDRSGATGVADDFAALEELAIGLSLEVQRLHRLGERSQHMAETKPVTIGDLIARAIKYLREECGRTQAHLAADMVRMGFVTWKRITVAETESGKRRPTWEELVGLCALFGTSLETFVGALMVGEVVKLNETHVMAADEYAQMIGIETQDLYKWGLRNVVALARAGASIARIEAPFTDEDWRPIAEYRRRERQTYFSAPGAAARRNDEADQSP